MRILITGGAGFIGSNFVRHLRARHPDYRLTVLDALTYAGSLDNLPPELLDDGRFRFCHGNIRNAAFVEELMAEADAVVHLAAETHVARSIHDTVAFFETDVLGTQAVANAAVRHPVERFIHLSTSEVYGSARSVPMTEDHPLCPTTPYASAKLGADRLVYAYAITFGLPAIILRPFNTYGPWQHLEKVVPRFVTSALAREPLTVHGDGSNTRDWLYVADLCEAIDLALHADLARLAREPINLGTGRETGIRELAELILRQTGRPAASLRFLPDRPGQVRQHRAATEQAERLLGWRARTDLEAGLEQTCRWYAEHEAWWRKLRWMRSVTITGPSGQKIEY
jgi:dTDP-glucose 4,6-dehydratase